ncbi:MAG: flagellar hook-basal body complex protein FliE [Mucispirillum sp.]|nr:flagellar hook-basal body complex protein FliE [Mucispirillum sp.]
MSDIRKLDILLPNSLETSYGSAQQPSVVEGDSFSDILKTALNSVDSAQHNANAAIQQALNGESADVHDTMIAMQKADTSLKMMMEVRNKLLEAYQEVIKTQI